MGKGVVDGHAENTQASFQAAVDAGVQWLETDVRACGDGTLVLAHHPTTAEGRFFSDLSFAEASACGVATLDELLEWVPEGVGLNLEVKSSLEDAVKPRSQTTAALFAARVTEIRREHRLLVTSFDPSALLILRERAPEVPIGLLGWVAYPLRKVIPAAAHLGCQAVIGHAAAFGPNSVDSAPFHREASWAVAVAHEAGLQVGAWCPGPEAATQLIDAGVDAVIVNEVPAVLAALGPRPDQAGATGS